MIFKAIEEKLYNPEIGFYTAYGIAVTDESAQSAVSFVSDVFSDENKANDFAKLLNECKADAIHLEELCMDAIEC